jgi:hypothetical protein
VLAVSMMHARSGSIVRAALLAAAGALAALLACSSGGGDSAAAACVSAKCLPGNQCVATAAERASGASQCRFPCAAHTDCPFDYHCDANAGGTSPYCVADATPIDGPRAGQWGASCSPLGGLAKNPDCDVAQGFVCNGSSPTDGAAFCTRYGCASDADCGHGFYCGRVNQVPSVESDATTTGATIAACLPRGYCAPCASDVDCGPATGQPQSCVAGTDGVTFCAPHCATDASCHLDATCTSLGGFDACLPRAGVCKGDGSLCAPCRSDADCTNGVCARADFSDERFCTAKSGVPCKTASDGSLVAQCPKAPKGPPLTSCTIATDAGLPPAIPPDQCVGEVADGTDDGTTLYVFGCWTRH